MSRFNHRETHYTSKLVEALKKECKDYSFVRIEGVTTLNGFPDILGWSKEGKIWFIEAKLEGGQLDLAQQIFKYRVPISSYSNAYFYKSPEGRITAEIVYPIAGKSIYVLGKERA